MGCQFLNTHSVPVSTVFACSTNVQLGEPSHLFYATSYAFNNTQKEDTDRFIRIGTQVYRHLMHIQMIALESAETELESGQESDFPEGLSRMLSGMCANLSKAVCSSPIAHLIMSNNGSRFEYSHTFNDLLVGQAIVVLNDKEDLCCIRANYSQAKKSKVFWLDYMVADYLYRPEILDKICMYEYASKYE